MTDNKSKRGFASNKKLASEAGKKAKAKQTPKERSERARKAAYARWGNKDLPEITGYEDMQ